MKSTTSGTAYSRLWRQILAAWLLACAGVVWGSETKAVSEYQVKAVFLFRFTQFVEWPAEAGAASDRPFVIGIVGEDPFGTVLDDTVRKELVQEHRPIVVQRFQDSETLPKCDILFIAPFEKDRLRDVLGRIKGQAVLTVADTAGAAEQGAMINLLVVQGSVKIEINQDAMTAAGLKVSAKLLSLAKIVKGKAP
jgi:hypothetical protein